MMILHEYENSLRLRCSFFCASFAALANHDCRDERADSRQAEQENEGWYAHRPLSGQEVLVRGVVWRQQWLRGRGFQPARNAWRAATYEDECPSCVVYKDDGGDEEHEAPQGLVRECLAASQ